MSDNDNSNPDKCPSSIDFELVARDTEQAIVRLHDVWLCTQTEPEAIRDGLWRCLFMPNLFLLKQFCNIMEWPGASRPAESDSDDADASV